MAYKSNFEKSIAASLKRCNIKFKYEERKLPYVLLHNYTPDFFLPNGIIIEAKGRFTSSDRTKMLAVKKQHPELDIRLLFMNSGVTLSKRSKTTYGEWATKHGFLWAQTEIPLAWIKEKSTRRRRRRR